MNQFGKGTYIAIELGYANVTLLLLLPSERKKETQVMKHNVMGVDKNGSTAA